VPDQLPGIDGDPSDHLQQPRRRLLRGPGRQLKFSDKGTAFFKVDNIGNDPAAAPQTNLSFGINPALYDVIGRVYRVGMRYQF
jgi:hypothetical protein